LLGRGEDAIETPKNGEGKNDVLVLAALERVADQIRNTPEKADDFTMVHFARDLFPGGEP